MSQALEYFRKEELEQFGTDQTAETRKFVKNFDRFFDCMNVRCISEGRKERKPDLRPYCGPCDSRLAVSVYSVH